jgi:hypothetical protein
VDVKRLRGAAIAVLVLAGWSLPAGVAVARPSQLPSCPPQTGVSALDQYCAALPGATGQQPTGPGQRHPPPPLSTTLPRREIRQLQSDGPAASALLTVPAGDMGSRGAAERRAAPKVRAAVERSAKPAPPQVVSALATAAPDVLGGAFRWGLVTSTLGIVGLAWLRFRARVRP